MAQGGGSAGEAQYWAFISYSHKDAGFARRLHRKLESYALPRRLARTGAGGALPKRLTPIFRDRDELAAAHDLSAQVRAALEASRSLVVVCSPAAAASPWVSREVEVFRALHPDRPILAAIRDGDPSDCFPRALTATRPDGTALEPLAADFRAGHDGEQLGLLKLVAGIVGVGLDSLVQRDAHRRTRRVTAVTAGALVIALAMSVLTGFALSARSESERQRAEAEGLVEFMLTDLRDRLKGVGRLDVMTAVNERALHYYEGEDLNRLPVGSLERRARILHAMGEDDETRGDHDAALAKFREAWRTTAALLAEAPNDPERIFDHAQSEYWIGAVDYGRGQYVAAKPAFHAYKALADRLVALAPATTKYRREAGYAESNLCTLAFQAPADPKAAIEHCSAALKQAEEAARHPDVDSRDPQTLKSIGGDLMNCFANLGDAYRAGRDTVRARAARLEEQTLLDRAMKADPRNKDLEDTKIALQIALAELDGDDGNRQTAEAKLEDVLKAVDALIRFDPTNGRSKRQHDFIERELKRLKGNSAKAGE